MDPLKQYLRPSSPLVSAEVNDWWPHLVVGYQDMHCRAYQPDCCCCNWMKIVVLEDYNLRGWIHTMSADYECIVLAAAAAVGLGTQSGGYQSCLSTEKRTVPQMDQTTCSKS